MEPEKFGGNEGENVEKFIKNIETYKIVNSWDGKTLMKNVAKSVIREAQDFFITEENGNIHKWEDFKIKLQKEFGKNIKFLKRDLQNAKQGKKN